jgi:Lar family restriction alleviation protein
MSEEKTGLKNCPFCDSDKLEIQTDMDNNYYVCCYDCLGQGGAGITEKQAKVLWNMRVPVE